MDNETIDGLSMDIEHVEQEKLRSLFPQCFVDGQLSITKLMETCGIYDTVDENDREKYEFRWKGKQLAQQQAGKRSAGTLRPCPEESVNWDTTKNIYIEGDNLEVLKLLQRAYFRKVKFCYIDPPYNTGNDFIYNDDFADPIAHYKEITSQTTKSNPETMGRFHAAWLDMMWPRLRLAANLLRDDGVIFISIDDNEVHNLRKICDEVFGEENFVDCITWNTRVPKNDNKGLGNIHQYILIYAKNASMDRQFHMAKDGLSEVFEFCAKLKRQNTPIAQAEEELKKLYTKKGFDRGITLYNALDANYEPWGKINMSWPNSDTFGPTYDVVHPISKVPTKKPDRGWRWNRETFDSNLDYGNIMERHDGSYICGNIWFASDENTQPSSIKYLRDVNTMLLRTVISLKSDGGVELEELFGSKSFFSNPKPTSLIKLLVNSLVEQDGIILDFFSGSATTAHAVMQLNAEDGGNRQFIMVQLPEPTAEKSEAYKAGYKYIAEIGKERIRRTGVKIYETLPNIYDGNGKGDGLGYGDGFGGDGNGGGFGDGRFGKIDIGFKVFKLDSSNLKQWDDSPISGEDAVQQLEMRIKDMLDIIKPDRSELDIVYEVMLKLGQELTLPVLPLDINGKTVFGVGTGNGTEVKFIVCFAPNITPEDAEVMSTYEPGRIIFANACFGNSEEKTNVKLNLRDKGIAMKAL